MKMMLLAILLTVNAYADRATRVRDANDVAQRATSVRVVSTHVPAPRMRAAVTTSPASASVRAHGEVYVVKLSARRDDMVNIALKDVRV